jgi:hypothetical protein
MNVDGEVFDILDSDRIEFQLNSDDLQMEHRNTGTTLQHEGHKHAHNRFTTNTKLIELCGPCGHHRHPSRHRSHRSHRFFSHTKRQNVLYPPPGRTIHFTQKQGTRLGGTRGNFGGTCFSTSDAWRWVPLHTKSPGGDIYYHYYCCYDLCGWVVIKSCTNYRMRATAVRMGLVSLLYLWAFVFRRCQDELD